MTEISPRMQKAIRLRIIKGIQRNGDRIFTVSQMKCPVRTGNLKNSGYKINIADGCTIGYRANYAQSVHDGTPVKQLGGGMAGELVIDGKKTGYKGASGDTQLINVRSHGKKAHTRVLTKSTSRYDTGSKTVTVGPYSVKAHTRTYVGKRLVSMATKGEPGVFKVVYHTGGQKANPFLADAVRQELHWLPEDIGFYLKHLGEVKVHK